MFRRLSVTSLAVLTWGASAKAVTSAELYTGESYQYGRFAARMQFAPGSGVVSSFFLWKDGSEVDGVFWNELDIEKLEAECRVETNTIFGDPEGIDPERAMLGLDLCSTFHVYAYEWTPEYISWTVDGVEVRREEGETALAFSENATEGMQLRFNVWPGDSSFGGDFDPSILPVYEYIDWVEYSSYVNGAFQPAWREDFSAATLPSGWQTGSWGSPKGLSTHASTNVGTIDGYAVLSLTSDEVTGIQGATPAAGDTAAVPTEPAPTASATAPAPESSAPGTAPLTPTAPTASSSAPPAAETEDEAAGCAAAPPAHGLNARGTLLFGLLSMLGVFFGRRRARRHE